MKSTEKVLGTATVGEYRTSGNHWVADVLTLEEISSDVYGRKVEGMSDEDVLTLVETTVPGELRKLSVRWRHGSKEQRTIDDPAYNLADSLYVFNYGGTRIRIGNRILRGESIPFSDLRIVDVFTEAIYEESYTAAMIRNEFDGSFEEAVERLAEHEYSKHDLEKKTWLELLDEYIDEGEAADIYEVG